MPPPAASTRDYPLTGLSASLGSLKSAAGTEADTKIFSFLCIQKNYRMIHSGCVMSWHHWNIHTREQRHDGTGAYLKAVGDVQFRRGNPHEIVHQHHDHDGYKHCEITDGRSHLHDTHNTRLQLSTSERSRTQAAPALPGFCSRSLLKINEDVCVKERSETIMETIAAPAHTEPWVITDCGYCVGGSRRSFLSQHESAPAD